MPEITGVSCIYNHKLCKNILIEDFFSDTVLFFLEGGGVKMKDFPSKPISKIWIRLTRLI